MERSGHKCELCSGTDELAALSVAGSKDSSLATSLLACKICREQISGGAELNINHWRCLNDCMWSQEAPVQVISWRMLKRLSGEGWAQDLLDMMYLEPEILKWAEAGLGEEEDDSAPCKDCNGTLLQDGDSVTIIKDLVVKGAGFTAKRGTTVKNISLTSNPEHIEGRVNGTRIVLLSCFLKKIN